MDTSMTVGELIPRWQGRILSASRYAGIRTVKAPTDFWMYQELVFATRPQVIIEIGNYYGGMLLAMAHWLDVIGMGRVKGVDLSHANIPNPVWEHPRIDLFTGDACAVFPQVAESIDPGCTRVLVLEDSSHTFDNTLAVLNTYSVLVQPGGYFIVEDTICHHGLDHGPQPGPFEAVQVFLGEHPNWAADRSMEAFEMTWNSGGYLKRNG